MKHLIYVIILLILSNTLLGQESEKIDKAQIKSILKGEWERDAIGYEKKACKESDRFILSFIFDDDDFNADGYLEYFTYLSRKRNKKICYLDHGSESFVFIDINIRDAVINLDVTGYMWSENWILKIIDLDRIILDNKEYSRSKLKKTDDWYKE